MAEFPEKIWAIEKGYPSRYRVSCSVLEHGPDEATEYVRADLYAALKAQLAEARKALERIEVRTRSVPSDTAEDDKRDKYHANSISRRALEGGEF